MYSCKIYNLIVASFVKEKLLHSQKKIILIVIFYFVLKMSNLNLLFLQTGSTNNFIDIKPLLNTTSTKIYNKKPKKEGANLKRQSSASSMDMITQSKIRKMNQSVSSSNGSTSLSPPNSPKSMSSIPRSKYFFIFGAIVFFVKYAPLF